MAQLTSDRAYRYSVIPLSGLLSVGGVMIFCAVCCRFPITSPFPLVESESGNHSVLSLFAVYIVITGIGLLRRMRLAWYALLVYLHVCVAIPIACFFDPRIDFESAIIGSIGNTIISTGIYYTVRPVFSGSTEVLEE